MEKGDLTAAMAADGTASGFIRLEVDDVSEMNSCDKLSPVIEVHGMPWSLKVKKDTELSFLKVYLYHRESESEIWSINVLADFIVINLDEKKNHINKILKTFTHEISNWITPEFIKWEDVINQEKGFIQNNKITIEARFTLTKIIGIRMTPLFDFTNPNEPLIDITLVIGGEEIYILAVHSPVFYAMFYGNFDEKNKTEIELKDVDHKEFMQMLNQIYPSYEKITDANAVSLLKIADQFQIKTNTDQVEQFVIDSTTFNDHCFLALNTLKGITNLKTADGYKDLSKNIKATLLDKVMKPT